MVEGVLAFALVLIGAAPVVVVFVWYFWRRGLNMLALAVMTMSMVPPGAFAASWSGGQFDAGFFLLTLPLGLAGAAMLVAYIVVLGWLRRKLMAR